MARRGKMKIKTPKPHAGFGLLVGMKKDQDAALRAC